VTRESGIRLGRPPVNREVIAEEFAIVVDARKADEPRPTLPLCSDGAARRFIALRPPSALPETTPDSAAISTSFMAAIYWLP
jgi:hypothetical protein